MAVTLLRAYGGHAAGAVAGTFGTVPTSVTVPTTFTAAQGCVCQLYT